MMAVTSMLARFALQTARLSVHTVRQPTLLVTSQRLFSFSARVSADRKYTEKHEWILVTGNSKIGTVGISEHAQESLGEIVYVSLPEVGNDVEENAEAGTVESVKAASDIYSPVTGKIVEINETLMDEPGLINSSPLDKGWIFKVEFENMTPLEGLMDEAAYKEYIKNTD